MLDPIKSNQTTTCLNCQKLLTKKQITKKTQTCSRSCSTTYRYKKNPPQKKEIELKHQKECLNCGKIMKFQTQSQMKKQTCCSISCASKMKWESGEMRKKWKDSMKKHNMSEKMKEVHIKNPNIRKEASERMKKNNPMFNSASLEKMKKSLKGKTFLSRGGNGKLTKQQKKLYESLGQGWEMEFTILTKGYIGNQKSLPNHYNVDIANSKQMLIIEIDGKSHKLKKWKFIDKRKTEILTSLGWIVLRFWNEEIDNNIMKCVEKIQMYTI